VVKPAAPPATALAAQQARLDGMLRAMQPDIAVKLALMAAAGLLMPGAKRPTQVRVV
jgi:hypothetical protein